MKIGKQITVFAGGIKEEEAADKRKEDSLHKLKTVYAGDIRNSIDLRGRIEHRKGIAKNQAQKIVRDAWNGDRKLDRELEQLDRHTICLRQTIREQLGAIHDVDEQKEALRKRYGISDEDLEILDRYSKTQMSKDTLTEEEEAYYRDITEQSWYAEYRQRIGELNTIAGESWKAIGQAKAKVVTYNLLAKKIHEERLKVHPMLDAQKKAAEVKDAAAKDVIGMVMDETKEKADKQQKEREEKSEAIKEEKEAREELLEKRKEEETEQLMEEIPLEQTADGGNARIQIRQQLLEIQNRIETEVQQEVLEIQKRMYMSVETLKSLLVDVAL